MKGIVRIGGALGVGVIIILGALNVSNAKNTDVSDLVVVTAAPERNYIESTDSDGDGIKDWEENLGARFTEIVSSASSSVHTQTDDTYTPPTTLTGKFSEAFFKDYLDGKIKGEDFSDPTKFIGNAISAIEKNTQSSRHSRLELTIVPTTFDAVNTYGNELPTIMQKHTSYVENEVDVLQAALDIHDPAPLAQLTPVLAMYTKTIEEVLPMNVPEVLVEEHLAFLNACEALATDIRAFQVAFDDPLYALARLEKFNDDKKAFFYSLRDLSAAIKAEGVTYMNDEPGAFFYLFENLQ